MPRPRGRGLRNQKSWARGGRRRPEGGAAGAVVPGAGLPSLLSGAGDPSWGCLPGRRAEPGTQASAAETLPWVRAPARLPSQQPGPARAPLAAHLSGALQRSPSRAGASVRFPRAAAAANAAPAAAARAGLLPRCRRGPGPRPPPGWPRLPPHRGRGPARRQLWVPAAFPVRPRGSARLPEPARPLVSRARSHSRLAHGHPPHGPATHTALGAPRRRPRLPRAAPAAPAPSHRVPAPRLSSRVSGLGPSGRCGGQGPRAGERRAPQTGGMEREAPFLRPAGPERFGRGARRARGAGQGRGAAAAPAALPLGVAVA